MRDPLSSGVQRLEQLISGYEAFYSPSKAKGRGTIENLLKAFPGSHGPLKGTQIRALTGSNTSLGLDSDLAMVFDVMCEAHTVDPTRPVRRTTP